MKRSCWRFFSIMAITMMVLVCAFAPNVYTCIDAKFIWDPYEPKVGDTVTFDASISSCNWNATSNQSIPIISYEWDFGDGATDEGEIVTHEFSGEGTYHVTLIITDAGGDPPNDTFTIPLAVETNSNPDGDTEEFPWWVFSILLPVVAAIVIVGVFAIYIKYRKQK